MILLLMKIWILVMMLLNNIVLIIISLAQNITITNASIDSHDNMIDDENNMVNSVEKIMIIMIVIIDQYNITSKGLFWLISPFPITIGSLKEQKMVGMRSCWFFTQYLGYRLVPIYYRGLK